MRLEKLLHSYNWIKYIYKNYTLRWDPARFLFCQASGIVNEGVGVRELLHLGAYIKATAPALLSRTLFPS